MPQLMAEERTESDPMPRIRLIIDTDDIVRRALARRAKKLSLDEDRDVSNSEVATRILREALEAEINEIKQASKRKPKA